MSEGAVEVVRIGPVEKHPNADTLSITNVWDYPVVFRTGDFKEGDLAIYVPVDSIVPLEDERFKFLKHPRIKAARLRGTFSMGLLVAPRPEEGFVEGQDVTEALGIQRWQPSFGKTGEGPDFVHEGSHGCEPDPGYLIYYDLDGLLKYRRQLEEGEEVVITEKLEGENARTLWHSGDQRLYVASHGKYKRLDPENPDNWWRTAQKYGLEEKLKSVPDHALYYEIFGHSKKFNYGHQPGEIALAVFDILNIKTRTYLDYDDACAICRQLDLPVVPLLYRGPWSTAWTLDDLMKYADGPSTVPGATHIREGMVVRTVRERYVPRVGRMVFKMKGESYMTMKGKR